MQGGTNANLPGQDGAASIPLLKEGDQVVGYFFAGSWLAFPGIDLTGYTTVTASVASAASGGSFEVRLDAADGELVATISVPNTGSWETFQTVETTLTAVTGVSGGPFMRSIPAGPAGWGSYAYATGAGGTYTVTNSGDSTTVTSP